MNNIYSYRSLIKLISISGVTALCLTASALHAQTLEFGLGDRSENTWGIGEERTDSINIDSAEVTPGFATQENINVFAGGDTNGRLKLTVTVNPNNQIPKARVAIKTAGNSPANYYFDLTGKSGLVEIDAEQPLNSPAAGALGSLNSVEFIEVKGQWNNTGLHTSFAAHSLTLAAASSEVSNDVASKTLEFGQGDRSGIAWGHEVSNEEPTLINIDSATVTPGFATQENINIFAGGDTSAKLKLSVVINPNNEIQKARVAIKTPGNSPANYYFDLTGLSGLVEIEADQALNNPAAGTLGDLSAVEFIEVKGQWNNTGLHTSFGVQSLTLPGSSNTGGSTNSAKIYFGTGDRAGSAWGWEEDDQPDHISVDNSSNRGETMPGFATMENLDSFTNLDLTSRLKLNVDVDSINRNNRVRVALGYDGGVARYYFDMNSSGELTADTALSNPTEGTLPSNVAISYIEVRAVASSDVSAFDVKSLSTGTSGDSGDTDNAIKRNVFDKTVVLRDGRVLDFEHLATTRSKDLPFEWTTRGSSNKYYGFFNEVDPENVIDNNDDMFTENTFDSHSVQTDSHIPSRDVDFRSNSHRQYSDEEWVAPVEEDGQGMSLPNTSDLLGDFRIKCQWSHFAYDDPIVFSNTDPEHARSPGRDKSHLHMFWGNTDVDWSANISGGLDDDTHIVNRGGSSCNGGALNRSSYWIPALMHNTDHAMVPTEIVVYYKTWEVPQSQIDSEGGDQLRHHPNQTKRMPQGLQLIAGNGNVPDSEVPSTTANDSRNLNLRHAEHGGTGRTSENIYWSCGGLNGNSGKKFNRIPTFSEWTTHCSGRKYLNASIYFPQCMQADRADNGHLRSPDFRTHVADTKGPDKGCPAAFPNRIPRLGYLLYWDVSQMLNDNASGFSINNLRLSSDPENYSDTGGVDISSDSKVRGGTLHGDWVAAWHDEVMDMWIENCSRDGANCSVGQTGTGLALRPFPENFKGFLNDSSDPANNMFRTPDGSSRRPMSGM